MRLMKYALLFMVAVLPACGAPRGKVTGQVLYQGKPLPGGLVTFQPVDPKFNSVAAEIDSQGNYEAMLPVGEVKVAIDNRELQPPDRGRGASLNLPPNVMKTLAENSKKKETPPPPAGKSSAPRNAPDQHRGKYVPIPEKYYTAEDSGLDFKVESGEMKHDIELK